MKKILLTMLSLIIMTSSIMAIPAFAKNAINISIDSKINTKIDAKINTNMYYFNSQKTVVNDKGIAVSISTSGSIATCSKLSDEDWKIITNKKNIELKDIIIVNNKFMAVAALSSGDSLLLTSEDGMKWTEKVIKDYYIMKMFYINNSYFTMAIDSKKQYAIFQTKDFVTFNKLEAKNNIGLNIYPKENESNIYISDIAYFKGRYYLCGMYGKGDPRGFDPDYCKGIVISSKDLKTWQVCTKSTTILRAMVQSKNTLIAYGGNSYKARLIDKNEFSTGAPMSITSTNMVYSNDGIKFNDCNINFETGAGAFDKISFIGDKFFGLTYKKIGVSSDGITWNTLSDDIDWKYGGYYEGKYVAVGTDIHDGSDMYAVSNENSGWDVTLCLTNFSAKTRSAIPVIAIESDGHYVLSEDTNDISSDLLEWKGNLGHEFAIYKDILFDGKRYVAVTNDTVISSLDGVTWETNYKVEDQNESYTPVFNDIHFSNGKYYIYGKKWGFGWESYVWMSDDLTNWQEYKIHINNYIENTNSDLSGIKVSIIGNKAILTKNSSGEEKTIIATSDDMYNFTPIMTDTPKFDFSKIYYYNNKYMVLSTAAGKEETLSSNPYYSVVKSSNFDDYIYISDDLKTFKKLELPSEHVKALYFFKDTYVFAASEYLKSKVYTTKDFKKFESYEIPTERADLNLTGNEEDIYDIFSIDDVLYITGARAIYTKNFKDWTILDSLPYNGYVSAAVKGKNAVLGGYGVMVRLVQNDSIVTLKKTN